MLVRNRKSRIYFLSKFFDYPITLSKETLMKLGLARTLRIGFSYLKSAIFPPREVKTLEQFFISRFGETELVPGDPAAANLGQRANKWL